MSTEKATPETAPKVEETKAETKVEKPKEEKGVTPEVPKVATIKAFSPDPKASLSENVKGYMSSREFPDYVKVNDFLKSLFKLPKVNETPEWQNKRMSKDIKSALDKLQSEGVLKVLNDAHKKLGGFFYDLNDPQQRTMHYHIGNVDIFVKK